MVILFNGRSLPGILEDTRRVFPDQPVLVVTRDGDTLPVPAGPRAVAVSDFHIVAQGLPAPVVVVANGGTTAQLVGVLRDLVTAQMAFQAVDLQRDGLPRVLWEFDPDATARRYAGRLTQAEARELYHTTWW